MGEESIPPARRTRSRNKRSAVTTVIVRCELQLRPSTRSNHQRTERRRHGYEDRRYRRPLSRCGGRNLGRTRSKILQLASAKTARHAQLTDALSRPPPVSTITAGKDAGVQDIEAVDDK